MEQTKAPLKAITRALVEAGVLAPGAKHAAQLASKMVVFEDGPGEFVVSTGKVVVARVVVADGKATTVWTADGATA